jgi:aspartate-semialdehyde dehydrogenase
VKEIKVGLLGATGAVGQRYVNMLTHHPFLKLEVLMGGKSAGKKYKDATKWMFPDPMPEEVAVKEVRRAEPESAKGCDLVFSALPSETARDIEPKFAARGFAVVSEASAHRMDSDVPLMIPEVNPDHLNLLHSQREKRGWKRGIVTTPNCTVTGLALVLKPIVDRFPAKKAIVTTMQALSGAGYPGVASLLIVENILPYIQNEEEKVAKEAGKILGNLKGDGIQLHKLLLGVSCNRVPVIDGHMETLYCEFEETVDPNKIVTALENFRGPPQNLKLPTAPDQPIIVSLEKDRPQPRLDRMAGTVPGMSVTVGRVRSGIDDKSVQLTFLSHNTIRGASGTAILTAELMAAKDLLN